MARRCCPLGMLLALTLLAERAAAFVPGPPLRLGGGVAARQRRPVPMVDASALAQELSPDRRQGGAALSRRDIMGGAVAAGLGLGLLPGSSVAEQPALGGGMQLGRGERALRVPAMGVGAWSWGDAAVWGYGTSAGASEASIEQAYRACLDNGITFIDTAEVYGTGVSESILGKLLAATPPLERSKVQVATKFYPVRPTWCTHTHTHTHTHARTHARTRAHTHARTYTHVLHAYT